MDGLNKGFSLATGAIYGFLNAVDYLVPGALARVDKAFSEMPEKDVISGHTLIVDESGNPINRNGTYFSHLVGNNRVS